MTSSQRRLTSATLALAGALVLTSCGGGNDTAATANEADLTFLTSMKPHHEQAVEMSDLVLAADPPAPVAELAQQVKAKQAPEIEQMDQMLADVGEGHGEDHMSGGSMQHGGMMSDADMQELMNATGTDAARLYLEGMIEHHEGAIDAAEMQIADGKHQPAVQLAEKIAKDQAGEIEELEALLASL